MSQGAKTEGFKYLPILGSQALHMFLEIFLNTISFNNWNQVVRNLSSCSTLALNLKKLVNWGCWHVYMFRRKDLKMYDLSYSVDKQHHQPNLLWFRLTCLWIWLQHLWDAFQVTMTNRHHALRTLKEEITPEATRNTVMPVRAITTAAYEYQRSQPVSTYLILQNCNSKP